MMLDRTLRIDSRRKLPPFARQTFAQWFRKHSRTSETQFETTTRSVVLFNDTFVNFNYPEIGRAAVNVLERLGYRVILADKKCCGRPMISKGLVEPARRNARWNVNALSPYAEQGIPIIGLEPSCLLTLRDEYPDLVDDPRARTLSQNAFLIDEFLAKETDRIREWRLELGAGEVLFHGHCHQKALVGSAPSLRVLRSIPGIRATEIDSGCCGMAGAFGYEKEHYEVSVAIGERCLIPAVKQAPDALIVADGVSCRQQLLHTTGRNAIHLVELLARTPKD
jgi:Fe-S oxidoreductase